MTVIGIGTLMEASVTKSGPSSVRRNLMLQVQVFNVSFYVMIRVEVVSGTVSVDSGDSGIHSHTATISRHEILLKGNGPGMVMAATVTSSGVNGSRRSLKVHLQSCNLNFRA